MLSFLRSELFDAVFRVIMFVVLPFVVTLAILLIPRKRRR